MWVICRVWFWVAVRIAHSCDFCGGFAFDIDGWMRNWRERCSLEFAVVQCVAAASRGLVSKRFLTISWTNVFLA